VYLVLVKYTPCEISTPAYFLELSSDYPNVKSLHFKTFSKTSLGAGADYMVFVLFKGRGGKAIG